MSNQSENEQQRRPETVRQSLLAELNASKQAIADLSNEEMEAITGGVNPNDALSGIKATYKLAKDSGNGSMSSIATAVQNGTKFGTALGKKGIHGSQAMYDHAANHLWDKTSLKGGGA
jgi:hypothetical protein